MQETIAAASETTCFDSSSIIFITFLLSVISPLSPFSPETFNMPVYNAENQTYDTPPAQGSGHEYLLRQIRRETACAKGQDRNVRRRLCGGAWIPKYNVLRLGNWSTDSATRKTTRNCESTRSHGTKSDTERVNSFRFSENLEKFSNFSTLAFQESNGFSERIFDKFRKMRVLLLDIPAKCGYNTFRDAQRLENITNRETRRSNQNRLSQSPSITPCDRGRFFYVNPKPATRAGIFL